MFDFFRKNKNKKNKVTSETSSHIMSAKKADEPKPFNILPKVTENTKISSTKSQSCKEVEKNKFDDTLEQELSIEEIRNKVIKKANEILKQLNIDTTNKNNMPDNFLKEFNLDRNYMNAFKIFKYLVTNSEYDKDKLWEKQKDLKNGLPFDDVVLKEIYRCICEQKTVCTGYTSAMVYLLNKIGIPASQESIAPPSDDKRLYHAIVVFMSNGEEKICDPTLAKMLLTSGNIKKVTLNQFTYSRDVYFGKIRPSWKTNAKFSNVDIEHTSWYTLNF